MRPTFLIVDLFCGAGGTTTGFAMTDGIAKVIACVNHDPQAIKSHWLNHPEVKHYEEDIRTLELSGLVELCRSEREKYPDAKLILWASLECTNFSKAKGGQPRDADSRTLAESLYLHYDPATNTYSEGDSYIQLLQPDYVMIENVVEFMSWGPLDDNGKPLSRKNGQDWIRWCNTIDGLGYRNEWRTMNSADYGAYTSRNRLFGIFAKPELPIVWPDATHAKNPNKIAGAMFSGTLEKWKAVKDVLDFGDEGESIFTRKKPLSEKTLERIYAGLVKYVAGGKDAYMIKYMGNRADTGINNGKSLDEPCVTIATSNRLGLVQTAFLAKYFSGRPEGKVTDVNNPAGTITTFGNQTLVQAVPFICQRNNGNPESKVVDVNGPARTLTATGGNQDLVQASFLHAYYGNGENNTSTDSPAPTLTTKDRCVLVQANYLLNYQHSSSANSVEQPSPTITTHDKYSLVQTVPFLERAFTGGGQHSSVDAPAGSLLAVPKMNLVQSFLLNPSWGGNNGSTEQPCPVVVARQDKAPLYLVQTETGELAIAIFEDDSECARKIKQFMALYGIVDIRMRMLKVSELLKIQGFPDWYELTGTQTDKKKHIGNSVVPIVVKMWALALAEKLNLINRAA